MYSNTQYLFKVSGGNEVKMVCMGTSLGNEVLLSSSSVHFGEV